MEGRLEYEVTSVAHGNWLDLARDYSGTCSKSMGATNSKGELLTYVCDISFVSDGDNSVNFYSAKENWVTKNAFKKWWALREFMFKESGIKKRERGRYGSTLRPYFDPGHADNPQYTLDPIELNYIWDTVNEVWTTDTDQMTQGGWVYSQVAVETNPDSATAPLETDTFNLHLVGPNASTTGIGVDQQWSSVGMILGYMADRSHPTAEPDDPVDFRSNPLALLRGRSESTIDVVQIASDMAQDGPPYDTTSTYDSIPSMVGNADMANPVLAGFLNTTSSGQQIVTAYGVRLPGGLCKVEAAATCEFRVIVRRVELAHA